MLTQGSQDFPKKGFIYKHIALKLIANIPPTWAGHVNYLDGSFKTFAQCLIDQKFQLKQIYHKLLSPDFSIYQQRWNIQDNISCKHWGRLAAKVS